MEPLLPEKLEDEKFSVPPLTPLKSSLSVPVQGSYEGTSEAAPPLKRSMTDTAVVFLEEKLEGGKQQFSDALLQRLISDGGSESPGGSRSKSLAVVTLKRLTSPTTPSAVDALSPRFEGGSPLASSDGWICLICLQEQPRHTKPWSGLCGNLWCHDAYCSQCLSNYFSLTANESRFLALPLRCPSPSCFSRVPTKAWAELVPRSCLASYRQGARNILSFTCPTCEVTDSLFIEEGGAGGSCCRTRLEAFFESVFSNSAGSGSALPQRFDFKPGVRSPSERVSAQDTSGSHSMPMTSLICSGSGVASNSRDIWTIGRKAGQALRESLAAFENADGTAGAVVTALLQLLEIGDDIGLERKRNEDDMLQTLLLHALRHVNDLERRCMLHLECLRQHPKIHTPCCMTPFCFLCKIKGHHPGITCEERQRSELHVEVQFCPSCGVPTQLTQGCSRIVCLCGAVWNWQGEGLDSGGVCADESTSAADSPSHGPGQESACKRW